MPEINQEDFHNAVKRITLSNKNFNKIFCIGYNKTGTTTLEFILRLYGYNLPNQQEQETRLTKQVLSTDYAEFINFVAKYDGFQDSPFSQSEVYVAADALFPNSKFILSERDANSWYKSLTNFHSKVFNVDDINSLTEKDILEKFNYLYPGYSHFNAKRNLTFFKAGEVDSEVRWDLLYDKETYIKNYIERNQRIKQYFNLSKDKLLIIDITKEKTTKKICDFLNIPENFVINMPQLNKT